MEGDKGQDSLAEFRGFVLIDAPEAFTYKAP